MNTQEQGMWVTAVADDTLPAVTRTRDTVPLTLRVEKLGVAAPPMHVQFSYTVTVTGILERLVRVGADGQPAILIVDGVAYAVPAGTLIEVDARELR
jgi:hypothetical protein